MKRYLYTMWSDDFAANLRNLQGFPPTHWTLNEDAVFHKLKYLLIVEAYFKEESPQTFVISLINKGWICNAIQSIKSHENGQRT